MLEWAAVPTLTPTQAGDRAMALKETSPRVKVNKAGTIPNSCLRLFERAGRETCTIHISSTILTHPKSLGLTIF